MIKPRVGAGMQRYSFGTALVVQTYRFGSALVTTPGRLWRAAALAGVLAIAGLGNAPSASAQAACPASYASGEEKLACIQDDNCSLSKKWPAETKRLKWLAKESEAFIEANLAGRSECVSVGDMQALFKSHIKECKRREAETGIILSVTNMLRRDRLVSDRRGINARVLIGPPELGDC